MSSMSPRHLVIVAALWLAGLGTGHAQASASGAAGVRLYVLEGGVLASDPDNYHLRDDEVGSTSLSLAAYLIVHPRGVLLWDAGAVADAERIAAGTGAEQVIIRADLQERHVTLGPPLLEQLATIGYSPSDVTHLALSHYHWDHTANANELARATWLVRPQERAQMFADPPGGSARPITYSALEASETILVTADEYDVFGDGAVILRAAPGHTPGHQVLYVNLARTGGVVLCGDLYHYPEERSLDRLPRSDFDVGQTQASRAELEAFLERTGAALWIQHDLLAHRELRKAPDYYD